MASPSLLALASLFFKSVAATIGTTLVDLLAAVPAGHAYRVASIIVSNTTVISVNVSVAVVKSGGTAIYLVKNMAVPAGASIDIIAKNSMLHLEEGDKVQALAGATASIDAILSYEDYN